MRPPSMMSRLLAGMAALALTALAAATDVGGASAAAPVHGRDVSALARTSEFHLTDVDLKPRTASDFLGKVVVLSFGYTHCPDACPTTLARFAAARELLGKEAGGVEALFVTVDPQRDTPELLRHYVAAFDASIVALRGSELETDAATRAFHANYEILDYKGTILVDHTTTSFLVDRSGRIRIESPYDQSASELADDLRFLLHELDRAPRN